MSFLDITLTARFCEGVCRPKADNAFMQSNAGEMEFPAVELINIGRRFGDVAALAGISLSVQRGEFFSLLGPSGCGKTTLLRLIAGLDLPDTGRVRITGQEATQTPAHERPVNTVFQSYALFPHLNVRENISFGLRMKKVPRPDIERRVIRVMEMAQISELAGRRPSQLSGGQKQRVALARAIVNEPQVLLLDEPLGALDLQLRKELQIELHTLQRRLGITFIYVTHDQEEALAMSDRVAVMKAGRMEQLGPVEEVYERPRTRFVAKFLGACNLLEAKVHRCSGRVVWARTSIGEIQAELGHDSCALGSAEPCTFAIRPEKVRVLGPAEKRGPNCFPAHLSGVVYSGAGTQYHLETAGGLVNAWVLNASGGLSSVSIGQQITIQLPPESLVLLED